MEDQSLITLEEILAQDDNATVCSYKFIRDNELLTTPVGAIGIKNANELEEIARLEYNRELSLENIGVIYWPAFLSQFIMRKVTGSRYISAFVNKRLRLIIPEAEWLYFKNKNLQERTEKLSNRRIVPKFYNWAFKNNTFHQGKTDIDRFYKWFDRILNDRRDPEFPEIINYTFGTFITQENHGSSVLFPPVPIISNQVGLDICLNYWGESNLLYFARTSEFSGITRPIGMLLTMDYKFFQQNANSFDYCLDKLEEMLPSLKPELIIVRPVKNKNKPYSTPQSTKLRDFIDVIIQYGKKYSKPIGIFDHEGFSRLGIITGTNIAGVRLDGSQKHSYGGGGYVPPENRRVWSQSQLEMVQYHNFVKSGPNIPHLPQLSRIMQNEFNLPTSIKTQAKIRQISVAEGLSWEINEIIGAIFNGELRTYENRIMETSIAAEAQHYLRI